MATGISAHEKLSEDALTAAMPNRDPHPLPGDKDQAILTYPNRLSEAEILKPLPVGFTRVSEHGDHLKVDGISPNSLVLADNLFGLHGLIASGQKATLIYLDPPYNTGMDFQSRQLEHAYKDTRGVAPYIEFMRRRLILMRELLADDGSIYVHIGHQMLAHLKVVMDEVFGGKNFRNIIARRKCSSKNFTSLQYANLNDYILFYSKTAKYKWNKPGEQPEQEWIEKEYPKVDARGRYKFVPVHAPGTRNGETGSMWRGMMPPPGKHWQYLPSKLDAFDKAGEIHWSRNGNPRRKVYLTADKLVPYTDYWAGFRDAHHQSIVITGYPTEKNLSMLRMIVGASSDPGDLVVDPFCGSGTTLHAADNLDRQWVGIDESFSAIKATIKRFRHGLEPMGDYVADTADAEECPPKVLDLFGSGKAVTTPKVTKSETRLLKPVDFSFLVDDELFGLFGAHIQDLAST